MVTAMQAAQKAAKKAITSCYDGKCTVIEHQKVQKPNKTTVFADVVVYTAIPCRLSFQTTATTKPTETAAAVAQVTKVFLAPEIKVKPGSKLTITQNGVTTEYKSSGEPAVFGSHQEIMLELFKGWA